MSEVGVEEAANDLAAPMSEVFDAAGDDFGFAGVAADFCAADIDEVGVKVECEESAGFSADDCEAEESGGVAVGVDDCAIGAAVDAAEGVWFVFLWVMAQ